MSLESILKRNVSDIKEKLDKRMILSRGLSVESAMRYNRRFSTKERIHLMVAGCSAEEAEKYSKLLYGIEIAELFESRCPEKEIERYQMFYPLDVVELFKNNIPPDIAISYKKIEENIQGSQIVDLIKSGTQPSALSSFDENYSTYMKVNFIKKQINTDTANEYPRFFNPDDAYTLIINNINLEDAKLYLARLLETDYFSKRYELNPKEKIYSMGEDIVSLIKSEISPETAGEFARVFKGQDIVKLLKNNITADKANKYLRTKRGPWYRHSPVLDRFDGWEIVRMIEAGIKSETIEEYSGDFKGYQIAVLQKIGLTKANGFSTHSLEFYNMARGLLKFKDIIRHREKYAVIGTGKTGVVLLKHDKRFSAWKFSPDIDREYAMLKSVRSGNIVRVKAKAKKSNFIKLEYIRGDSLENILKDKLFNPAEIFYYASDIMKGLIDMRRAGIFYHRDIRPANIMIDYNTGRAMIIDLEIATRDRHALPINNRRYGGPNDLVSLSQIMYKMATGEHLFAESKSMEMTMHANELKDQRDEIYADPTGKSLGIYLAKVDHNIQNERLRTIIKACLTAENFHYKNIYNMFKKYGEYK